MSEKTKPLSSLRVSAQPSARIVKSDRTRAAILNAALDFLWSHPFRDMTVTSLMAPTSLSRSVLYQYFSNLHEVMEALLDLLKDEVLIAVDPWLTGRGDPVALMHETMDGLVRVCYHRGPFLRAFTDAASSDLRFEKVWNDFSESFDDAVAARIEADQEQGLISEFDARPVAFALNRMDALAVIDAFGSLPRKQKEPVRIALTRIWTATLYGGEWHGSPSSNLVRKY